MLEPIEKLICKDIHEFVKEHIDEVENKLTIWGNKQTYKELGFNNRADMLKQIKNDVEIAVWALQELMRWGMSPHHDKESFDYTLKLFTADFTEDGEVYKVGNPERYFIAKYDRDTRTTTITEVKKITKLVEVNEWKAL
jgi:hypothetical protein